jgi:hypothetical protein
VTKSAKESLNVKGLIIPKNTGTEDEPELEVAVLGKLVEEAKCETADKACKYKFSNAITPKVTTV